jgi:Sec-independent protein secretion pathway component TatC
MKKVKVMFNKVKRNYFKTLNEQPVRTLIVTALLLAALITPPDVITQLIVATPIFVVMFTSFKVYQFSK